MNESTATGFIDQLFNTVQTGLILIQAIYDEVGQIVDFRVVRCNDNVCRLSGFSHEQLLSETVLALEPNLRFSGMFDSWVQVLQTGLHQRLEYYFSQLDVWFDVSLSSWEGYLICSLSDISGQKKAERKQQEQAGILRGILDNIPVDVWIFEAVRHKSGQISDFRIVEANQRAIRATGLENRSVIGQLASDLFPQDRTNGLYDRYVTVVESQQEQQFIVPSLQNQQLIYLSINLIPHGQDQLISTSLDVTSLKLAQQEQQKQAELLDRVFNSSQVALTLHEPIRNEQGEIIDFCITKMNNIAAKWIQVSPNQVYRLSELLPDFNKSLFFQMYYRVFTTGEPARFENSLGKYIYEFKVSKLGEGLVISANNITRLRHHQNQLEQANLDLLRSNENLQQFAYVASHDLQEPLRKIQAFGDLLIKEFGPTLSEHGVDIVNRMQTAARRMSDLISDLLSYSRISTERESFRPVSLQRLLKELINDLELSIQEQKAQIAIGELPTIQGDRSQLRHLFQNLLSNALKFRKANVPPIIQITCQPALVAELPTDLNASVPFFVITVTDNGIGFDEKYTDRIFQVFQRLHGRSHYSGTGVGLAICKKVVENHNGAIIANSQPNQGARFRVFLPV